MEDLDNTISVVKDEGRKNKRKSQEEYPVVKAKKGERGELIIKTKSKENSIAVKSILPTRTS